MTCNWLRLPICVLAACLCLPITAIHADDDADRARDALRSGRVLSLAEIMKRVTTRYPGEVLEAELDDDDAEYELRILTRGGRIIELEVDGRTGRILDVDEDD